MSHPLNVKTIRLTHHAKNKQWYLVPLGVTK